VAGHDTARPLTIRDPHSSDHVCALDPFLHKLSMTSFPEWLVVGRLAHSPGGNGMFHGRSCLYTFAVLLLCHRPQLQGILRVAFFRPSWLPRSFSSPVVLFIVLSVDQTYLQHVALHIRSFSPCERRIGSRLVHWTSRSPQFHARCPRCDNRSYKLTSVYREAHAYFDTDTDTNPESSRRGSTRSIQLLRPAPGI
jgi:hypothetical protein